MGLISFYFTLIFLVLTPQKKIEPDSLSGLVDSVSQNYDLSPVKNVAFQNGEELTFRIRYGFITAGTAKMSVATETYKTIPVYHLRTTAESASTFSWIYEVQDIVSSFVDSEYFYPLRFEKRLREGGYKADLLTDYLPDDSLAKVEDIRYQTNMKVKKKSIYDVKVPPYSQDILSSFYYIRLQNLKIGESVYLTNHEKKKVYDMEVIVHKKETIEVEAGTFRCILIEPIVKGEGLFQKKGRLRVWLTDDERKIPVQMKSEVLIGDITTELIKIKGIKGKIEAKKN
jgi:Protein of unknown function (DUF3108)